MRRLVLCADGTWNTAEAKSPTNVTYLSRAVRPVARDGVGQLVFYHAGVGTGPWLDRFTGGAFGAGIDNNIKDLYRSLVLNYEDGDETMLFGFSRGAYTVRSAVGMIRKCGLLRKEHADRLKEAYDLYRKRGDQVDGPEATAFREKYSRPRFEIAFLGVWDTVGSLGIPLTTLRWISRRRYQFHDAALSRIVRRAYHAVAIDERRGPFRPTLWETQPDPTQVVEQTWFSGVHGDIGGGYPARGLADITLRWMADRAKAAGLDLNEAYFQDTLSLPDDAVVVDETRFASTMHNSATGWYLVTIPHRRAIGQDGSRSESVWHTARRRLEIDPEYRPENLRAYLERADALVAGPTGVMSGAVSV